MKNRNNISRADREELDAVVHLRSSRRCHYERRGFDPVSVAVRLLAETGDVPGWDSGLDEFDGGEDWAA